MKLNSLDMFRGTFMLLLGILTFVLAFGAVRTVSFGGLCVVGVLLCVTGCVELLCGLKILGDKPEPYPNTEEAERLVIRAAYYEFMPLFKSGNNVPVPSANVSGDLGRRVSDILRNASVEKK